MSIRRVSKAEQLKQENGGSELAQHDSNMTSVAEQSLAQFVERLADPEQFCGGGAVAAMTLAASAATVELVVGLAHRRRALAAKRPEIERILATVRGLRPDLLGAADRDIALLQTLLKAQRAAREASDASPDEQQRATSAVNEALWQAATAPVELAARALDMLYLILQALEFATRFTISDLGAAAALSNGAIEASLLMSEVNLALLGDDERADELRQTIYGIRQEAPDITWDILEQTRGTIAGKASKGGASADRA